MNNELNSKCRSLIATTVSADARLLGSTGVTVAKSSETAINIGAAPSTSQSVDIITGRPLAASYARKSSPDDLGLEAQHALNARRAWDDGYVIPLSDSRFSFEDDGTRGQTIKRDGFGRLERIVEAGAPFQRLYVKDQSRLGRWDDPRRGAYYEIWFSDRHAAIRYSDRNNQPENYSNAADSAVIADAITGAVMAVSASTEASDIRRRLMGGKRRRVTQGFYPGSGLPPYGTVRWLADLRTGELLEPVSLLGGTRRSGYGYKLRWLDEGTREVVRRIYREVEGGRSLLSIANALNADGIPAPGVRLAVIRPRAEAAHWAAETIREIARHPIYCGDLVYGRTSPARRGIPPVDHRMAAEMGAAAILYTDWMPDPPVSRDQWDAVQSTLASRVGVGGVRHSSPAFLLSGRVVCATCGAGCHGQTIRSRGKRARTYRYYQHADGRHPGVRAHPPRECPAAGLMIRVEVLEPAAITAVGQVLESSVITSLVATELSQRLADASGPEREDRVETLEQEVVAARAALFAANERMADAQAHGISAEIADAANALIYQRAESVRASMDRLNRFKAEVAHIAAAALQAEERVGAPRLDLSAVFDSADVVLRKRIVQRIVSRVTVDWTTDAVEIGVLPFVEVANILAMGAEDPEQGHRWPLATSA